MRANLAVGIFRSQPLQHIDTEFALPRAVLLLHLGTVADVFTAPQMYMTELRHHTVHQDVDADKRMPAHGRLMEFPSIQGPFAPV